MKTAEAKICLKYYKRLYVLLWWNFFDKKRFEKLTICKLKIAEYESIIYDNYLDGVKKRCAEVADLLNTLSGNH